MSDATFEPASLPDDVVPIHDFLISFRKVQRPPVLPEEHRAHHLLAHIKDVCPLGQHIWKLTARWDITTMTGAMCLLSNKRFGMAQCLLICGFLHILYWDHAVAYALSLIIKHPSLCPCDVASLDVDAWCIALKWVGAKVEEKFQNLRVHKGKLILKPRKQKSGAVMATRNLSCWNRKSDTDWSLLLDQLDSNRWLPFCLTLAEALNNRAFFIQRCKLTRSINCME